MICSNVCFVVYIFKCRFNGVLYLCYIYNWIKIKFFLGGGFIIILRGKDNFWFNIIKFGEYFVDLCMVVLYVIIK